MAFTLDTTDTGGTFTPVPAGIHAAVCLFVADLGMQVGNYGPKPTLLFTFEIPALLAGDGKPMQISRRFGKTLAEKSALRPFLQSWLGAPLSGQLDIEQLAGRPAMLVVSQSQSGERIYSNITTAAPVAPGTPIPAPSIMPLCYGPGRDPSVFAALPEWIRKAITAGGAAPAGVAIPAAPMAPGTYAPPATYAAPMPAYSAPAPAMPTAPTPAGYVAPVPTAAPIPAPAPMAAAAPTVPAPNVQTAPQVNPGVPFDDQLSF
jgi:hypothetical protein